MEKRLIEPDFIKGLCIILMVYGHIVHIGYYALSQENITSFIYTFHMPIFLIISGFFFRLLIDSKDQIIKTIRTLVIPFIVFEVFYLIGLIIVEKLGIPTSNKGPQSLLLFFDMVFIHPIGGYWFLHSLAVIMSVLILINKFFKKDTNGIIFIILSLIIFYFLDLLTVIKIRTSVYFLSGYFISILINKKINIHSAFIFIFSVFCALIYIYDKEKIYRFSPSEFIWCFLIFSIFWSIATVSQNLLITKIICWIGKNTLIILVLHAFFIVAFKMVAKPILLFDSSGISYSLCATTFTIIGSLISARIFDSISISPYLFNKDKIYIPFD